jgi:lysozyme family protein
MALTFDEMLRRVLKHEGGYVNHPLDPGGATNKGVTQATYNEYLKKQGKQVKSVRGITDGEVFSIYYQGYFLPSKGNELSPALAFQVFDAAVNSGVSRAIKWLQEAVGTTPDGLWGPKTAAAVAKQDVAVTIDRFLNIREKFLKSLSTWKTFGRGWKARIDGNRKYAKEDLK